MLISRGNCSGWDNQLLIQEKFTGFPCLKKDKVPKTYLSFLHPTYTFFDFYFCLECSVSFRKFNVQMILFASMSYCKSPSDYINYIQKVFIQ